MSDSDNNPNATAPENREPTANSRVTPATPFILFVAILWGGMHYFDSHGGSFDQMVQLGHLDGPPPNLGGSPINIAKAKGKAIYGRNCAACHQPNGAGNPLFPPLAGSDWVNGVGPNRIIRLILDGVQGPITVSGKDYNNAMVPWRPTMTDDDIAAVVTYIRNEAEWGNESGDLIIGAQVKAIRDATAGRAGAYSPEELLAIPHSD